MRYKYGIDKAVGPRQNWPGATRGPYRPGTWDPSEPHHGPIWAHTGSPYGPHMVPTRVAHRAAHMGPIRIRQWCTMGPYGPRTWDPSGRPMYPPGPTMYPPGPLTDSQSGPQVGSMCTTQMAKCGPYRQPTLDIDPNGQETHFGVQKPDAQHCVRHAASPCWSKSLLKMVALELQ